MPNENELIRRIDALEKRVADLQKELARVKGQLDKITKKTK